MNSIIIPESIKSYISEIAAKMMDGRAAVMIGAGFSRNAIKSDPNRKDFPTWNELGDLFYEKIHGDKPKSNDRYLNILKLAEEVDATFGRAVLNEILLNNIPDKDHLPSDLHKDLLNLSWSDIFTTNYDTLLERTCEHVYSRKFDIVTNHQDLVYSKRPRIVKLHGSFPSDMPLIVSEGDYRRYPKLFAPFINTVQQVLLENVLCLIGFSADDPNFLQWVGWIHDNLGKDNSPKIYMIGLFNYSDVQRRNLEMKNIILVNLNAYEGIDGNHSKALQRFFQHLQSSQQSDALNWPTKDLTIQFYKKEAIQKITLEWRSIRERYPNWVILPEEKREYLWTLTSLAVANVKDILSVGSVIDLEFCFELNWRLEKCLYPLIDNVESVFEKVIEKYTFLRLTAQNVGESKQLLLSETEISILQKKWLVLNLALLRSYRISGKLNLWNELYNSIVGLEEQYTSELAARLHYEKAMFSLFSHNYKQLWTDLNVWPYNESLSFWEAKRAGLLVEMGQEKEAMRILEQILAYVRKQLNLNVIRNDFSWVSQESYIMFSIFNVDRIFSFENRQQFNKRWSELVKYKCDPLSEMRLFDQILKSNFVPWSSRSKKESFDIGFTKEQFSNSEDHDALRAYSFIRYLEETGTPISLNNGNIGLKLMAGALRRVVNYSPYLVLSMISRYSNVAIVEEVLDRTQIAKIEIDNIDLLIDYHLNVFYESLTDKNLRKVAEPFVQRMPEVLSRLSVRCSPEAQRKLYKYIFYVYVEGISTEHMRQLLARLSRTTEQTIQCEVLIQYLDLPLEVIDNNSFPDPFQYLNVPNFNLVKKNFKIPEWKIAKLLNESECDSQLRELATYRLYILDELGLLKNSQKSQFKEIVWTCLDENSFPIRVTYDKRYILSQNLRTNTKAEENIKAYLSRDFILDESGTLSMHGSRNQHVKDLIKLSRTLDNPNGIAWTSNELAIIIQKLENWWNVDKVKIAKYVEDEEELTIFSGRNELRRRFKDIIDVIIKIVPVEITIYQNADIQSRLKCLICEMEQHGVPVLRAKGAFVKMFYEDTSSLFIDLEKAMKEKDEYVLVDAFDAILFYLSYHNINNDLPEYKKSALDLLVQPLRWSITPHRKFAVSIVNQVVRFLKEIDISSILPALLDYLRRGELYNELSNTNLGYLKADVILASGLHEYLSRLNQIIPDVIMKCKEIANNKDQFRDIAFEWN